MLSRLIESGAGTTARRHWLPSGLIAVAAHAVIVAGAALATLEPAPAVGADQSAVIIAIAVMTSANCGLMASSESAAPARMARFPSSAHHAAVNAKSGTAVVCP